MVMVQSPEYPDLQFVKPRAYGTGRRGWNNVPRVIVVHYTAGAERSTSAEDGAAYDARRTDGTSTHYFVDSNSVVQCVLTKDRANAAFYNGNTIGIQYELCGTVQTREQWLDAASRPTLKNAAKQILRDCTKYNIPIRKLSPSEVAAGKSGICGHVDITHAFPKDGGTHTDPGPHFPWDVLLADINALKNGDDDDMSALDTLYLKLIYENWAPDEKEWLAAGGNKETFKTILANGSARNGLALKLSALEEKLDKLLSKPDVVITDEQIEKLAASINKSTETVSEAVKQAMREGTG